MRAICPDVRALEKLVALNGGKGEGVYLNGALLLIYSART